MECCLITSSLTVLGQDIMLNAIRPKGDAEEWHDIQWLTLPEVLGTYGEDSVEMFETAVQVTSALQQKEIKEGGAALD